MNTGKYSLIQKAESISTLSTDKDEKSKLSKMQIEKVLTSVGVIPPRREIGFIYVS